MVTETYLPDVYEHLQRLLTRTTLGDKDPDWEMLQDYCLARGLTRYTHPYPGAMRYEITAEGMMAVRARHAALSASGDHRADVSKAEVNSSEQPAKQRQKSSRPVKPRDESLSIDGEALSIFVAHTNWSKKRIAEHIGTNEKSLCPKRCPQLTAAIAAYKEASKMKMARGTKDRHGNLEAYDE